jgi:predicted nuclease of predicted toxin-antitoxin system
MQPDWEIWLDNQLSSSLAKIMQNELKIVVKSAYILKNANLDDKEIFIRAKQAGKIIIITKDADFPALVTQYDCPPKVIKLNTGNLPTALLWKKYSKNFTSAIKLLQKTKAEIIFIE